MSKSAKKQLLAELEELAIKSGVKVRYEKTEARGGMCEYRGKQMIIINRASTDDYKISIIVENLRKLNLDNTYISDKLREVLETY